MRHHVSNQFVGRHRRLWGAVLVGLVAAIIRFVIAPTTANDLTWPLCMGRELLAGRDPYSQVCIMYRPGTNIPWPANPLTTAFITLPLTPLPDGVAAAFACGLVVGLLSWGLLRERDCGRLAVLLSLPFMVAFNYAQWSPLLTAVALTPVLLPLALAKPHIGLPIIVSRITWRRGLACIVFLFSTLIVAPTWPQRFQEQISSYDGYIPLLYSTGMPVLFALLRWRDPDAWLLLLAACVPQRYLYDAFILAAIPSTRREALIWTSGTWLTGLGLLAPDAARPIFIAAAYWPALLILFLRTWKESQGAFYRKKQVDDGAT